MGKKGIYIVGAGTYGESMYELAKMLGYKVIGFYDENESKKNEVIMGIKVLGKFSELETVDIKNNQFIVAIGNNDARCKIMAKINRVGGKTPTLIHPSAVISPSAYIGVGVYIQANAYVWTKAKINNYSIISPNVVIAHHTSIGKACLISTLSGIGASIQIKDKVFIGMGSTIVTGVASVGAGTIIGAGAVLIDSADKDSVYVGVPAKKMREKKYKALVQR